MKKSVTTAGLLSLAALIISASGPGGTDGTALWLKTVPAATGTGTEFEWKDFSGNRTVPRLSGRLFMQGCDSVTVLNFNTSMTLPDSCMGVVCGLDNFALNRSTVIGVFSPSCDHGNESGAAAGMVYVIRSGNGTSASVSDGQITGSEISDNFTFGDGNAPGLRDDSDITGIDEYSQPRARVHTYYRASRPVTSPWGCGGGELTIGSAGGSRAMGGAYPEICVYDRLLTPGERVQAESYLAMKYGITLRGSYLGPDGGMLWDRDAHRRFHNRVTAVSRHDATGFNQPVSATPLLVMGKERGTALPDGLTMIWGDDNAPADLAGQSEDSLSRPMERRWFMKSTGRVEAEPQSARWQGSHMTVTPGGYTDRLSGEPGWYDRAWSRPLDHGEGAMEFTCPPYHPGFDVGFNSAGQTLNASHGFRIGADGTVRLIIDGAVADSVVASGVNGRRLSVIRQDSKVAMLIDGTAYAALSFGIPSPAGTGEVRTTIGSWESGCPLVIGDMRLNGIGETGFFAELSYDIAGDLAAGRRHRRALLKIDPTCSGDFTSATTVSYRSTGFDSTRGKLLFNNITWPADSAEFTFALFDGLKAGVDVTPVTCGGVTPRNDGSARIRIEIGEPSYRFGLTALDVKGRAEGDTVAAGEFHGPSHLIEGLASGSYLLDLSQQGGREMTVSCGSRVERAVSCDGTGGILLTWSVPDIRSDYEITAGGEGGYGFAVRGAMAYMIDAGARPAGYLDIAGGDALALRWDASGVSWLRNDEVVMHHDAAPAAGAVTLATAFNAAVSTITDPRVNGVEFADALFPAGTEIRTYGKHSARFLIEVGDGCDAAVPNGAECLSGYIPGHDKGNRHGSRRMLTENEDGALQVTADNGIERAYTAVLEIPGGEEATLMVFDAGGVLRFRGEMEGGSVRRCRFGVASPGVYVVKAFTRDSEHTRKILVK